MTIKVKTCKDCGKVLEFTKSPRCEPCRHEHELETHRRWVAANGYLSGPKAERNRANSAVPDDFRFAQAPLELVNEPRPMEEGGFRKGARFCLAELRAMLKHSADALVEGTKFLNVRTGKHYEVTAGRLMVRD